MTPFVLAAIGAAAVLLAAVVVSRRRRPDTVASFRKQIDALSPDARRPTFDRARPDPPRPESPPTPEPPPTPPTGGTDTEPGAPDGS